MVYVTSLHKSQDGTQTIGHVPQDESSKVLVSGVSRCLLSRTRAVFDFENQEKVYKENCVFIDEKPMLHRIFNMNNIIITNNFFILLMNEFKD